MNQSRLSSLVETVVSAALGFFLAVLAQVFVFPLFGINVPLSTNVAIVIILTVVSVIRQYCVRRLFNAAPWRRFKGTDHAQ